MVKFLIMASKKIFIANTCILILATFAVAKPTEKVAEETKQDEVSKEIYDDYEESPKTHAKRSEVIQAPTRLNDKCNPGKIRLHKACYLSSIEIKVEQQRTSGRADNEPTAFIYVEGHRHDPLCSKKFPAITNSFLVRYGTCGVERVGERAEFKLIVQKHEQLIDRSTEVIPIVCNYPTKNDTATKNLVVISAPISSDAIETTIHMPEPSYQIFTTFRNGTFTDIAKPGDELVQHIKIFPKEYQAYAKNCVFLGDKKISIDKNVSTERYTVTDDQGCATDLRNFGQWIWHEDSHSLRADFTAFKFPDNGNLRFHCDVIYCYDKCPPLECEGSLGDPCATYGSD